MSAGKCRGDTHRPSDAPNRGATGRACCLAEDGIGANPHFVGNGWTAADVMMSFPAEIAVMQGFAERGTPKLAAFVEAVNARPLQPARERGGADFGW